MQYIIAFAAGGILCVIAQILIDKTKITPARILTCYVCAGVFLSAIGIYEPFSKFASAGASVPLTGFGHCLAVGAREAVDELGLLGAFTGGLTATAGGIALAMTLSLLFGRIFRGKPENL